MARKGKHDVASTYVSTGGFELTGAEEVIRALGQLPRSVENSVLGPALRACSRPLWKAARKHLRKGRGVETGAYRKSIGAKLHKKRRKGVRLLRVGARSEKLAGQDLPSNIDSLLEYGHRRGADAIPHLRPAMDEAGDQAVAAFNAKAKAGIMKAAAKLRAKGKLPSGFKVPA